MLKTCFKDMREIVPKNGRFVIIGDFNAPEIDWDLCDFPKTSNYRIFENFFFQRAQCFSLSISQLEVIIC